MNINLIFFKSHQIEFNIEGRIPNTTSPPTTTSILIYSKKIEFISMVLIQLMFFLFIKQSLYYINIRLLTTVKNIKTFCKRPKKWTRFQGQHHANSYQLVSSRENIIHYQIRAHTFENLNKRMSFDKAIVDEETLSNQLSNEIIPGKNIQMASW